MSQVNRRRTATMLLCSALALGLSAKTNSQGDDATKKYQTVLGTWDCAVTNGDRVTSGYVLTLRVHDGTLAGRIKSPSMGESDIEKPSLTDNILTFAFLGGRITYRLKVTGDTLEGTWKTEENGETGGFRGKRRTR